MTSARKLIFLSIASLLVSSAFMQTSAFMIGPVQPNLVLATLVIISLFTSNGLFLAVLVGCATILVRHSPVFFDPLALALALAVFSAFLIKQRVVWPDRIGVCVLMVYATSVMYLVVNPSFIVAHTGLFILELLLNVVVGLLCFELFSRIVGRGHQ